MFMFPEALPSVQSCVMPFGCIHVKAAFLTFYYSPFNEIFQFSHIARLGIMLQIIYHFPGDRVEIFAQPAPMFIHKVADQKWYVIQTFPQWRYQNNDPFS